MARARILIAGAGIGGVGAALALTRRGFEVSVYERALELGEVGAGLSVWPNATHVLQELGVLGAVAERAWTMRSVAVRTDRGDTLFTFRAPRSGPPSLILHRADLHGALVAALPPGMVHLGRTVTGVEQRGMEVVLRFSNGEEAVGDAVVGADGLASVVRGALHGVEAPVYRGYTVWRGILEADYPGHDAGIGSEMLGSGMRFGLFGIGAGRSYWYACETATEGSPDDPQGSGEGLRRRFGHWPGPVAAAVAAIDDRAILRNDAYDRPPLKQWGRGRVTLLGDAAHPTTPNLGQGACLALEDALVLARSVDAGAGDLPGALRRYEDARRRRAAAIVLHSRWVGAVGQWRGPLAVGIRNTIGRLTPDTLSAGAMGLPLRYRA